MQVKNLISIGCIAVILIAGVLMLSISTPKAEKANCCKIDSKECPADKIKDRPSETSLENLSHQFISLPVIFH